jgi:hypothetical protein
MLCILARAIRQEKFKNKRLQNQNGRINIISYLCVAEDIMCINM